jgi:hypothetical protein
MNIKAAVKSDGTLHKSTRNFLRSIQLSGPATSGTGSGGGSAGQISVPQTHVLSNPSIPSLLGRSNGHQAAHHPLPPPPAIHYPTLLNEPPSRPPPSAQLNSSGQRSRPPVPPVPVAGVMSMRAPSAAPQRGDEIDEGVLPDSDSDSEDSSQPERGDDPPPQLPAESRKRIPEEDLSAPPAKRALVVDYSVHNGQPAGWELAGATDAASQSLFASVMSQAKGGTG